MNLCFFTMANFRRYDWAYRLILSGKAVDRPIWFFRIPENHPDPKRYKLELLSGDLLPEADKYVYLDSDIFMLKHGNWESDEAVGAVSEEPFHISSKWSFADTTGYKMYCKLFDEYGRPTRVNTGLVAIPGNIRKQVGERWKYWCEYIESFCEKPMKFRDQPQFPFVMKELNIPVLPSYYCAIVKRENIKPEHIALHASGHPGGNDLDKYMNAANRLLGESVVQEKGMRWDVLTKLIIQYAPNPTYSIGAEVGVLKGENVSHLFRTFPGIKIHCIDNREPVWDRQRDPKLLRSWEHVKSLYTDHIIEHTIDSDKCELPLESLDYAFIDADHRTEAVIRDINHYLPMIKPGGFIAGHDIDYKGAYYESSSVRKGVEHVFGNNFQTGSDHTWWYFKK